MPNVRRISQEFPDPTLLNGQPQNWQPIGTTIEDWGILKVVIGGVDVTNYRGIPVQVQSWSIAEPFGYKTAEIAFPQITPFEALPAWLEKFADVQIIRQTPIGGESMVWRGLFASEEDIITEESNGLVIQCVGSLYQADLFKKKPQLTEIVPEDLFTILQRELDPGQRSGARWGALVNTEVTGPLTGILFQQAGSWENLLTGFIQELLSRATTMGGDQWTLTIQDDLTPELHLKRMSPVEWSVYVGQPGVTHTLSRDLTMSPNAFYGEGIDRQQCHWRNTRYPPYGTTGINGDEPPFFQPLIEDTATNRFSKDVATGVITGVNPDWDNTVVRVESYQNFGSYITREEAADSAAVEHDKRQPRYVGTITLKTDPFEGSRFDIKAGKNILFRKHRGVAGRSFHISQVDVDWSSLTVTLTVDESSLDYVTVAAVMERDRSTNDPFLRKQRTYRNSRAINDQKAALWDCESGAGVIPATAITGLVWNTIVIAGGTAGSVINTNISVTVDTPFAIGVFDRPPPAMGGLPTEDDFWDSFDESTGLLIAWGAGADFAGYSPGTQSAGDPLTGLLLDDASWYYKSEQPPWLWVVVLPGADTTISGLFRPGADF